MEIRQIKKEIDIRPASYLDENTENTEKSYLSLKCTKICCSTADMTSFNFRFVSNYILKKFDSLKDETVFLAICCARSSTAMKGSSNLT
jgi:hypothetical protein